ncbi:MAG: hypothetical protein AAGC93_29315 [Cyanobacteria bacterium P01_F01_bin.53]
MEVSDDFDSNYEGRGTDFVRAVEAIVAELPNKLQDDITAELDLLASLANANGLLGAEQTCPRAGIDIEGMEGIPDILLYLAVEHPHLIDRVAAHASMMRRTGGRDWSTFQFDASGYSWALKDENSREAFLCDTIGILKMPEHRKRVADWYETVRLDPVTGEELTITQATVYVEERAQSELGFGAENTLERRVVPKVLEVGLVCNTRDRIVEICAKGGKKVRDQYAEAFAKHFAPHAAAPAEVPRRNVNLHLLKQEPRFEIDPADGIERVEVSSLDFRPNGGGYARFDKRGDAENLYQFLERRFKNLSPLKTSGWEIIGTRIRIILAPEEEKRRRTLTVTLRAPNTTTLPNKTENDREFVFDLLERWTLLAPAQTSQETFEVVE